MGGVAFRTDASLEIGTGHVMRCLTLADALRQSGVKCSFVCRPHQGHLLDLIAQRGHQALALPVLKGEGSPDCHETAHAEWLGTNWLADAADTQQVLNFHLGSESLDWLVVDHYALDYRWEKILRGNARSLMVIDDLADRPHYCDLLLDQNLGRTEQDYVDLLHSSPTILIGPQYALLRPEFAQLRNKSLSRRGRHPQVKHLLVTMGGVDKDNATEQMLIALQSCTLPPDLRITVVMGPHAPWLREVQAQAARLPWPTEVLVGVSNMAQLMADSDLAISALGVTTWERAVLGLPSLVKILGKNQTMVAEMICANGAGCILEENLLCRQIQALTEDKLREISKKAAMICDGLGVEKIKMAMKL